MLMQGRRIRGQGSLPGVGWQGGWVALRAFWRGGGVWPSSSVVVFTFSSRIRKSPVTYMDVG